MTILIITILILFYYGFLAHRINGGVTAWLTSNYFQSGKHTHAQISATLRLACSGVQQFLFFILLVFISNLFWSDLIPKNWNATMIPLGLLLGIAEMSLIMFVSDLMMRLTRILFPEKTPSTNEEWYIISQGGWMRSFRNAIKILPLPASLALIFLYVSIEETIFRALIIGSLKNQGIWAIIVSLVLFVWVQAFNTPSWSNSIFPMTGAAIMGVVHGILYFFVPDIFPLVIAHVTMFFAATFSITTK